MAHHPHSHKVVIFQIFWQDEDENNLKVEPGKKATHYTLFSLY